MCSVRLKRSGSAGDLGTWTDNHILFAKTVRMRYLSRRHLFSGVHYDPPYFQLWWGGGAVMDKSASFSDCRTYRYALWRTWDAEADYVMFVGLNPSTADETMDDPTIRRCIAFAKDWGYGGLVMTNLFAYRSTDPAVMKVASDPVGPANDGWLSMLSENAGIVIAAWGTHGTHQQRNAVVCKLIPELHCLRQTKGGHPGHPLYLPKTLQPVHFKPR